MKKTLLSLVCMLFIVGCEPEPKFIGECPNCGYTKTATHVLRSMHGYKLPTVFCPVDGQRLVWRQIVPTVNSNKLRETQLHDIQGCRYKKYELTELAWEKEKREADTVLIEGRCIWNSEYRVHLCNYSTEIRVKMEDGGVRLPNTVCPLCLSEIVWYGKDTKRIKSVLKGN